MKFKINYGKSIVFLVAVFVLFAVISFIQTGKEKKYFDLQLCVTSDCIKNFNDYFSGAILILQVGCYVVGLYATVYGAYIALKTYVTSVNSAALAGHVSHLTLFKSYVDSEISKRSLINPISVEIFKWYKLMFPNSANGNIFTSEKYEVCIKEIEKTIMNTASSMTSPTSVVKYDYKIHQGELISSLKIIGISLARSPKNDFFAAETQILELIDSINMTFGPIHKCASLTAIDRPYL